MHKALGRIFFIIYLFTFVPLAGCYLSQLISPATFWPLAFLGLLFPVLIIMQLFFVFIFLFLRNKAIVLPILMIILGWGSITHTFQLFGGSGPESGKKQQIRVMTYNVRLFDIAHYWSGVKDQSEGVFSYVDILKPDILCFQEFALQDPGKFSLEFIKSR
ncbi:MAG: hypothetical protein WCW62_16805, partial [Bacteroidales bacterium]